MNPRQEAICQYRRELEAIREKKRELARQLEQGKEAPDKGSRRKKWLEELEECCLDNLKVLRESANPRVISYCGGERDGSFKDNKIFFLAGDLLKRRDNRTNRKRVAIMVRKILDKEFSAETRQVILRSLAGETKTQIARELGISVSSAARRYQKGMEALKRYCVYLEPYLR